MNITVTCVGCGQKLSAPESLAGRRVPCPKCKAPVDVPAAAPVGQAAPPVYTAEVVPENRSKGARPQQAALSSGQNPTPPGQASAWDDLLPAAPVSAPGGPGQIDLGLGEPLRSPTKRRSIGSSQKTLVPMIAIVVLLFLVGGGIGAFMMLSGKAGVGSDLKYVPDDSDVVLSADISGIVNSGAGQKIKSKAGAMLDQLNRQGGDSKIKPEDVGRVTFGVNVRSKNGAGIVHFNRPVGDADFSAIAKGEKKPVGQYQMIVTADKAFCQLDPQTIVMGDEASLRKVLERNAPARLSDDLATATGEADFSKAIAIALSMKSVMGAAGGMGAPGMAMMPGGADAIRGVALQADVGNDIRLKGALVCKDSAVADQMKQMSDGMLAGMKMNSAKMPPEASKILDTLDVSRFGATVRASVTLDVDLVASMLESAGKMAMPIGGAAPQLGQAQPNAAAPGFPQPTPPTATFPTPNLNPPVRSFPPANQLNRGNALAKVGAAAGREQASNNLRQIALALQQYVDGKGHFPPPAIVDSQGKPLLSWRVAILPNLGVNEGNLYKQFHLDEPWDSPANKRLLIRMPNVYRSPRGKNLGFGKTAMLVPLGQREAFYGRQQRKLRDFSDGTSNTILVVEAAPDRAVEWTKPDDLPFDEGDAAAGLFGQRDGGFLAAFADGTVKFIPQSIDKNILLALFTINGGETIPPDFDVKP
jgi:hypothetical protein